MQGHALKRKIKRGKPSFQRTRKRKKPLKPIWEREKDWQIERIKADKKLMEHMKNKRGITEGRRVTVIHSGKPWAKKLKSTSGKIIQVTDYFFVVKSLTEDPYCECFLFTDLFNNTIRIKGYEG